MTTINADNTMMSINTANKITKLWFCMTLLYNKGVTQKDIRHNFKELIEALTGEILYNQTYK
jgi:hypothetical protein